MSLHRVAYVLISLALAALAQAQTVEDLIPPSMRLDEKGLLQWTKFEPKPCRTCKSQGTVPCPFCADNREAACPACSGKRSVVCAVCRGKRKLPDRYESMICSFCEGHGRAVIGESTSKCALCEGNGRLPLLKVEGKYPRDLDEKMLSRTIQELQQAATRFDDRGAPDEENLAAVKKAITDELREIFALVQIPLARAAGVLAQVASGPDAKDPGQLGMSFVFRRQELLRPLDTNKDILETCLWRYRHNARVTAKIEPGFQAASALDWSGWFGGDRGAPMDGYTLLGRGFLRTETAPGTNAVIRAWLKANPKAVVVPVSILHGVLRGQPQSRMIFCWVKDGDASLNLHASCAFELPSSWLYKGCDGSQPCCFGIRQNQRLSCLLLPVLPSRQRHQVHPGRCASGQIGNLIPNLSNTTLRLVAQ